jgi:hypothetical protein
MSLLPDSDAKCRVPVPLFAERSTGEQEEREVDRRYVTVASVDGPPHLRFLCVLLSPFTLDCR